MSTFAELKASIRARYESSSTTRLSEERLEKVLNEGIEEVAERTEFYETYIVVPILGGRTYYDLRGILPDEAIRVTNIWVPKTHWWLKGAHMREFPFWQWEKAAGSPRRWWMRGLLHMGVFPRLDTTPEDSSSDASHMHVYFTAVPKALTSASQRIYQLPPDLYDAIEEFAMYDLYVQDGETPKGLQHWAHFKEMIELLKHHKEKRIVQARRRPAFSGRY